MSPGLHDAGNTIRRNNITRRSFKLILKRAGLSDMRFHDLRHTSASLLLTKGVHPKVVQERLGHSNINLALDTYWYDGSPPGFIPSPAKTIKSTGTSPNAPRSR